MTARTFLQATLAAAALLSASSAFALTCGQATEPSRLFTITPATECHTGSGNPQPSDINGYYPSTAWTKLGDITSGGDNSAFLDAAIVTGAWGSAGATGTWTLSASFWATYGEAVISLHAGNGTPEHAAFLITPNSTFGTFGYANNQRGGGFSNFILWGRGTPTTGDDDDTDLPEPGTLALFGLGLMGLGASRRRKQ